VVEGYFDAMRLVLAGIEETVAPLGTALTEQQSALLAKLTKNVFLLYDSDEAGLKATFRAGLQLLRLGVSARVASLPEGEDPDTFVRAHGAARLEAHLAQAVDIFDRQIMEVQRRGWFDELHKKRRAIDRLLPTLRATSDELTRDIYVTRLAEVSGVDREVLLRELVTRDERGRPMAPPEVERSPERPPGVEQSSDGVVFVEPRRPPDAYDRNRGRGRGSERRRGFRRTDDWASSHAVARVSATAGVSAAEKGLVQAMLQDRSQVDVVVERWGPEHFHHPIYRRIFERLLSTEDPSLVAIEDGLTPAEVSVVDGLAAEPLPNPATQVRAWLRRLELRAIDEERDRVNALLMDPEQPLSEAEKDALVARKQQLATDRAALLQR
jgi:DNA primase